MNGIRCAAEPFFYPVQRNSMKKGEMYVERFNATFCIVSTWDAQLHEQRFDFKPGLTFKPGFTFKPGLTFKCGLAVVVALPTSLAQLDRSMAPARLVFFLKSLFLVIFEFHNILTLPLPLHFVRVSQFPCYL